VRGVSLTDSVSGAVCVVESCLPEGAAGEGVEDKARGVLGEDRRVQRDVALLARRGVSISDESSH
jgi:hypothetical protein